MVIDYVQMRMKEQYNLLKKYVPFNDDLTNQEHNLYCRAPIYVSPDWSTNTKGALILIQGMGAVRAGLWSRKVSVCESLELGTMLPQIKFAVENGLSCLIMNPNYEQNINSKKVDPKVKGDTKHCKYVFKKFVKNRCLAKEIFIVAHSMGGVSCSKLIEWYKEEFIDRVVAIAFCDSSFFNTKHILIDRNEEEWFSSVSTHYIASHKKLGDKENDKIRISETLSGGHIEHEYITGSSWELIMKDFVQKSKSNISVSEYSSYSDYSYISNKN